MLLLLLLLLLEQRLKNAASGDLRVLQRMEFELFALDKFDQVRTVR